MPIRPEMKALYPPEWTLISGYIRFDRAMGRCECHGECRSGLHWSWWLDAAAAMPIGILGRLKPPIRCPNYHGEPSRFTGSKVVLTTAHLDHDPRNCDPGNLLALCQSCHLALDQELHAATRAANRRKRDNQMTIEDAMPDDDGPVSLTLPKPPQFENDGQAVAWLGVDAPYAADPKQCSHHLRCALVEGHGEDAAGTIAADHWAPHAGASQVRPGLPSSGVYWMSEASVAGARQLPVDDLAIGEQVLDLARKILTDPYHDEHVVDIKHDSWVCQHPIIERVEQTMIDCTYSDIAFMDRLYQWYAPGRYRIVRVNNVDTLELIPKADDDG